MNLYQIGDLVQVTGSFTDSTGTLVDPTSVNLQVLNPQGQTSLQSPSRVSVGVYYANISAVTSGTYSYRFSGTGAVTAADQNSFLVASSSFN